MSDSAREMTLDECVDCLPTPHGAKQELINLRKSNQILRKALEEYEHIGLSPSAGNLAHKALTKVKKIEEEAS